MQKTENNARPAASRYAAGLFCAILCNIRDGKSRTLKEICEVYRFEIDIVECQWFPGHPRQGLRGHLRGLRRGRRLPSGNEDAAGPGRIFAAGLSPILVQCREKGVFRHSRFHPHGTALRALRHRQRGAQSRGPRHHAGVRAVLPRQRLYAQQPE